MIIFSLKLELEIIQLNNQFIIKPNFGHEIKGGRQMQLVSHELCTVHRKPSNQQYSLCHNDSGDKS